MTGHFEHLTPDLLIVGQAGNRGAFPRIIFTFLIGGHGDAPAQKLPVNPRRFNVGP